MLQSRRLDVVYGRFESVEDGGAQLRRVEAAPDLPALDERDEPGLLGELSAGRLLDVLVERALAAGFEQQGDVEQERRAIRILLDEAQPRGLDRGMDDRLEIGPGPSRRQAAEQEEHAGLPVAPHV